MSIIDISNAMARQEDHTWNPSSLSWDAVNPNSLAQKNNNPGNLRFAGQRGAVAGAGGFAKFETPEDGFAALQRQINLDASRGLDLEQFINKYAPAEDHNDPDSYLSNVMKWLGLSTPNIKLSSIIGGFGGGIENTDKSTDIFGDDSESGGVNIGVIILTAVVGLGLWVAFKN